MNYGISLKETIYAKIVITGGEERESFFCYFAEGLFKEMVAENFTYVGRDLKIEFKKLIDHSKI